MATDIATLPWLGTLTSTEVHAFVVVFVPALVLYLTRARAMLANEIWYGLAAIPAALVVGELALAVAAWLS